MAATLDQLVRGITGAVTREDAKRLAKMHGHSWRAVLKAMKRKARVGFVGVDRSPALDRLAEEYTRGA